MGRSQPARANDFIIAVVRLLEPCGPQPPPAEARKRAPQAAAEISNEVHASTFFAKTIVPHPPPHSFERLLFCACYGLPQRLARSLGRSRHARLRTLLLAHCREQLFCGLPGLYVFRRLRAGRSRPLLRSSRALRPSIYGSCFSFFRTLRRMRCNPLRVSGVAAKRRMNSSSSSASHSAGVMAAGSKSGSKARLACKGAFRL